MVMWEDENMKVTNGLLRTIRVFDKRTGRTLKPDNETLARFMSAWWKVRRLPFTDAKAKRVAENELFHDLGRLTIDPGNPDVFHLTFVSDQLLAQEYYRRGEYVSLLDRLP
jgi:hypothetical protein